VERFSIPWVGGEAEETISVATAEVGGSCRLTCIVRGEMHHSEASDFFEAFSRLRRRVLEPRGLIPFCHGASLKVWPSAMSRDMGRGLKAYRIEHGAPASELVGIFDEGPDIIPSSVAHQENFAREWVASLRA